MIRKVFSAKEAAKYQTSCVSIPEGYTAMENKVFVSNERIEQVVIPSTMLAVSENAFAMCKNLQEAKLKRGIRKLKKGAFQKSLLREIGIPETVEAMEDLCFYHCNYMTDVAFMGASCCRVIPYKAFGGCTRLEWISLPDKLERIEQEAFYKCKYLEEAYFPESLTYLGMKSFYFTGILEAAIPEKVTYIGDEAFRCTKLKGVVKLPSELKYLGHHAFSGINSLEILEIPGEPQFIGEHIVNEHVKICCRKGGRIEEYARQRGLEVLLV